MNKIVCDLCGTAYPETASQCPICGTAKSASNAAAGDTAGYAYVKGGRFSHANVRKRNSGDKELPRTVAPAKPPKEAPAEKQKEEKPAKQEKQPVQKQEKKPARKPEKEEPGTNLGLIIIVIILILAIIAVCAYMAIRYIDSLDNPDPGSSTSTSPSGAPSSSRPASIPCTSLSLQPALEVHTFDNKPGDTLLLGVVALPENTTDTITYATSNDMVATVDQTGKITAIANGEAIITVTCGELTKELKIICNVGVDPVQPTDPSQPQPTDPVIPAVELKLNRSDFTLSGYGASHNLYSGELDPASITWTSSNTEVATVENGKVTAVGNGSATITAEYGSQKATCIVRCNGVEKPVESNYELRTIYGPASDITIKVGESLTIQLVDKESGLRVQTSELKFSVSSAEHLSVDANGKVTGLAAAYAGKYVYVEYEGVTYKCLIRVKNP